MSVPGWLCVQASEVRPLSLSEEFGFLVAHPRVCPRSEVGGKAGQFLHVELLVPYWHGVKSGGVLWVGLDGGHLSWGISGVSSSLLVRHHKLQGSPFVASLLFCRSWRTSCAPPAPGLLRQHRCGPSDRNRCGCEGARCLAAWALRSLQACLKSLVVGMGTQHFDFLNETF